MSKTLLIGAALLLAAVLTGLWRWSDSTGAGSRELTPGFAPTEGASSAEAPDDLSRAPGDSRPTVVSPAQGAEEVREEIVATPDAGVLTIACQDRSGAAVAGATVWVLAGADRDTVRDFRKLELVDALMEERGTKFSAPADGRVRVSTQDTGSTLVLARHGELWATKNLRKERHGEHPLILEPDVSLRVQVLDAAATPLAGVEVLLQQAHDDWTSEQARRTTAGAEGMAEFRHAQRLLGAAFVQGQAQDSDFTWRVAAEALTEEPVARDLEAGALNAEPVVLRLPPTGSVVVRVFDEAWEPYTRGGKITLESIPEGEPREISPFSDLKRERIKQSLTGSESRFDFVELGLEVGARVSRDGSRVSTASFGRGPRRAGEVVELDLHLGSDHPVVRLRALDSGGRPMVQTELECEVTLATNFLNSSGNCQTRSDERGFILVDLSQDWTEGTTRVLTVSLVGDVANEPTGSLDLSRALEDGVFEGGDLTLRAPGLFVAGRVEDETGAPLAGARIVLRSKSEHSYSWEDNGDFRARSDDSGSFEVRQAVLGETFQISAEFADRASPWVPFARGDEQVRIVLRPEGRIEGRVLLDEFIPANLVHVYLNSPGDDEEFRGRGAGSKELDEEGRFVFEGLLAGSRSVGVGARLQGGTLVNVAELEVRAGETCNDPRLDPIDLRGKLHLHELRLIGDEEGGSISGTLQFGPPGMEEGERGSTWLNDGDVRILSEHETLDMVISASGYRVEHLQGHSGKAEVRLRRGLTVTLYLTGDAEIPEPPIFVKPLLVPKEGGGGGTDWNGAPLDERREVKVRAAGGGAMKVEWVVERRSASSAVATTAVLPREQVIDVLDIAGDQRFEISLTADEMKRLLDSLN